MDQFLLFASVGFAAQLIDGALGMGYGVVSSSVLLTLGVSPAAVSAAVHASKAFTGAASATSHVLHRNVDFRLLWPLTIGGVIGGIVGTYVLTSIEPGRVKPFVIGWLFLMGLVILWRAWKAKRPPPTPFRQPWPLGLAGGFLDAMGGGGWGPTVTSTLMGGGAEPRLALGSSNTAEFGVALAVSAAFVTAILTGHWQDTEGLVEYGWAVAGLIVGGLIAAPPAGWLTKALPTRPLTWLVALLVLILAGCQAIQLMR
jgi:uncharacterized membrane protein YfcA